jgi:hypothetical protein
MKNKLLTEVLNYRVNSDAFNSHEKIILRKNIYNKLKDVVQTEADKEVVYLLIS